MLQRYSPMFKGALRQQCAPRARNTRRFHPENCQLQLCKVPGGKLPFAPHDRRSLVWDVAADCCIKGESIGQAHRQSQVQL
jgi:hypothetical protein